MLRPRKLQSGDCIAAVSLSWGGAGLFPHRYQIGKQQIQEKFGLKIVEMPHTLKDPKWIKENPRARAEDLMQAFSDKNIKGIFATIGGDDSIRMLPYIDTSIIRGNPKVFLGYSDTTVAHFMCYQAGLRSFYGPSIMSGFAENTGIYPYLEKSIQRMLFNSQPVGIVEPNLDGWTDEKIDWANPQNQSIKRSLSASTGPRLLQGEGIISGHLIGGCMETLEIIKSTSCWPHLDQWSGAILFFETSDFLPPIDYFKAWLRNYGAQGILQCAKGILFGRPAGGLTPNEMIAYDEALLSIVRDEFGLLNLLIMTQLDFGHTDPVMVIPYGAEVEVNCANQKIKILENVVL